jgi:hypothetical protein
VEMVKIHFSWGFLPKFGRGVLFHTTPPRAAEW